MRYYFVFVLALAVMSACQESPLRTTPVLIVTDIGTDVDDAEALCLAARITRLPGRCTNLEITGIACTAKDAPQRTQTARALMERLACNAPVGYGPAFIDSVLSARRQKTVVLLIAQATDLSAALAKRPELKKKIARLYFQGQALEAAAATHEAAAPHATPRLAPNPEAFNVSEDLVACQALFALQDEIPFVLVGKHAVYPLALSRTLLEQYRDSGHPAGAYLYGAALQSLRQFALNQPQRFRQIYHVPDTCHVNDSAAVDRLLNRLPTLTNPYDAVTVLALTHPQYFDPELRGPHRLIGMTPTRTGLGNKDALLHCFEYIF